MNDVMIKSGDEQSDAYDEFEEEKNAVVLHKDQSSKIDLVE